MANEENLTPFTAENQPDPDAKSKGAVKRWQRQHLRDDMFKELINAGTKQGKKVNSIKGYITKVLNLVFSKEYKILPHEDQLKALKEYRELLKLVIPEELKLDIEQGMNINFVFNEVKKKPKKKKKGDTGK